MSGFNFNGGDLLRHLEEQDSRMKSALTVYANNASKKLENYAKQNKPWQNRTYDARNRLTGSYEWQGDDKLVLALSHGVEYGIYLEKGTSAHTITGNPYLYWAGASHPVRFVNHPGSRAYPIIMPTIQAVGPEIMSGLRILLGGR